MFLSFMPCFGFEIAAQTLVGNSLGDNALGDARRCGIEIAKITTLFTLAVGALFCLAPNIVLHILTPTTSIIDTARPILRIAGIGQIACGSWIIFSNALQAAGATLYVMYLDIITHRIVFLPVAYTGSAFRNYRGMARIAAVHSRLFFICLDQVPLRGLADHEGMI